MRVRELRQFEEVMSLFAEEAVLETQESGKFIGKEEIREWVEFEFGTFSDSVSYFEDFEVDGSTLRMISSWTNQNGDVVGFRPDLVVIDDGQIQRVVFGAPPAG